MVRIGLREANLRFSRYLKMVKDGNEVILTDRGKPIAVIKPVSLEDVLEKDRIRSLEEQGILKRAKGDRFPLHRLIVVSGKPVSEIVKEERESRL